MSDLPGIPLPSGFTPLPDDEQEVERERWRTIQRDLAPFIEDVQRARREALAEAHTYVVGGTRE